MTSSSAIVETDRLSTLNFNEKVAERYAIERPRWSGWSLMGGGIDANEDWEEEHARLNQLYGADTYVPKTPRPLYLTDSNAAADAEPDVDEAVEGGKPEASDLDQAPPTPQADTVSDKLVLDQRLTSETDS